MSEFPEAPATLDELIVRWAQRDAEYVKSRAPMEHEQVVAIRDARMKEAGRLPVITDRAAAFGRAQTWAPPVHPEFGSIKEWLND